VVSEQAPEQLAPQQSEDVVFRVMELLDVTVTLPATHGEVQLTETESPYRVLSFPIGLAEAASLAMARDGSAGARPTTHELFSEVLGLVNVDVIALRITARSEGTYLAELDLMSQRGREVIACRPSDGLILCLRQTVTAPVLVNELLLDLAS
jgi:bifunctional DNase/RNase